MSTIHKYVLVKGRVLRDGTPYRTVPVYADNSSKSSRIGIARSTEAFQLICQEDADPHYYKIEFGDGVGYITSNTRYTEVIYKA